LILHPQVIPFAASRKSLIVTRDARRTDAMAADSRRWRSIPTCRAAYDSHAADHEQLHLNDDATRAAERIGPLWPKSSARSQLQEAQSNSPNRRVATS
jgi:hypothetical protein